MVVVVVVDFVKTFFLIVVVMVVDVVKVVTVVVEVIVAEVVVVVVVLVVTVISQILVIFWLALLKIHIFENLDTRSLRVSTICLTPNSQYIVVLGCR